MATERFFYRRRRHGAPIFPTLTFPDHDLVAGEINVLDAQVQAFGQPQSGAVQKHHHDPVAAVKYGKDSLDLLPGQHNRSRRGRLARTMSSSQPIGPHARMVTSRWILSYEF